MAGKPGLPRPESVGAGCCRKGNGLGKWAGQGDPALLVVLGGEDELHFTEPGV